MCENFISFIEKELMPLIESTYLTALYKKFIGYAFGGLLAMHIFIHHTYLFNSYICKDPSMSWDKQTFLKQAEKALAKKRVQGKALYLGIANTMESGMTIKKT